MDAIIKPNLSKLIDQVEENIQSGTRYQLVMLPTGIGRQSALFELIKRYNINGKKIVLFLDSFSHKKIIQQQLSEKTSSNIIFDYDLSKTPFIKCDLIIELTQRYFTHPEIYYKDYVKTLREEKIDYLSKVKNAPVVYFQEADITDKLNSYPIITSSQSLDLNNINDIVIQFREKISKTINEALTNNEITNDDKKKTVNTLNNILSNTNLFYLEASKDVIKTDLEEIQRCINANAYKAAIILTGSVLEAFLIDWLSEIKNKDFFTINYEVQKTDKHGTPLYSKNNEPIMKRADLIDYIKEIRILKEPDWDLGYEQADEIRKKRNLVHAKLFVKESDISKNTCTQIIDYLTYVIQTRWKNQINF